MPLGLIFSDRFNAISWSLNASRVNAYLKRWLGSNGLTELL